MEIDPDYMRGDVSLAYAQVLFNLNDWTAAAEFLPQDIQKWGHPESLSHAG